MTQESTSNPSRGCDLDQGVMLDLDDNLKHLALQEAIQLQQQLLSHLPTFGQLSTLAHQVMLRLTYYRARQPIPELQRADLLRLHRHSQTALALALERSHSTRS